MRQACRDTRRLKKGTPVSSDLHVLDDLEWRGLIAHSTDLDALRAEMDARARSGSTWASTRPRRACTWATCCRSSPRAGSRTPGTCPSRWSAAPPA